MPDDLTEAWSRMLTLFIAKRDAMFAMLHDYGLTPPHAHALSVLAAGPTRMRDLADRMVCDASYITAVVDRLEEVGLAERRSSASDRRVKEIALTDRGVEAAGRIGAVMSSAPAEFQSLSKADRKALAALLVKAVPVNSGPSDPFKPRSRG
ncbi:MAG: Transcriptional regulator, MarR family [Ilumatobacteraceae bacterium]|nr:Transcriptional regulator, MarR family [Ilumatobacteraceae bacterium]